MNEPLACWLFFFFLVGWYINAEHGACRHVMKRLRRKHGWTGRVLHGFLQWYTFAFLGLVFLFARTFYDIFLYDLIVYNMLDEQKYTPNLLMIPDCMRPNSTEAHRIAHWYNANASCDRIDEDCEWAPHSIKLPTWIRFISIGSLFAGLVGVLIGLYQNFKFFNASVKISNQHAAQRQALETRLKSFESQSKGLEKGSCCGDSEYSDHDDPDLTEFKRKERLKRTEKEDEQRHANDLRRVLFGMPLVFIVLALRANIRIWAIMTGSAYRPFSTTCNGTSALMDKNFCCDKSWVGNWNMVKRAEVATYKQDLEVASGFQFFAVGCFGLVCMIAFRKHLINKEKVLFDDDEAQVPKLITAKTLLNAVGLDTTHVDNRLKLWKDAETTEQDEKKKDEMTKLMATMAALRAVGLSTDEVESKLKDAQAAAPATEQETKSLDIKEVKKDSRILTHLAILGLWSFVLLGVLKTMFNVACAMFSVVNPAEYNAEVSSVQEQALLKVNQVFVLAVVLSVVNMFFLGQMKVVVHHVGGVNSKFNATRLLLLIGQVQQVGLLSLTTGTPSYIKVTTTLNNICNKAFGEDCGGRFGAGDGTPWPIWAFSDYQAMLLHSSLLCYECLIVVLWNWYSWKDDKVLKEADAILRISANKKNASGSSDNAENTKLTEPLLA